MAEGEVVHRRETLPEVTIRFAGDSGDGVQLTGNQFTNTTALLGNDLATFPDFPAEIRAPAGTLPGVSGFQIHFASSDIHTPGDRPDVLVVFNPAALKVHVKDLAPNGIIIANTDEFTTRNFQKAGITSNPLTDGSLSKYRLFAVDIIAKTLKALESIPNDQLSKKDKERCKNFYALGMVYWLFNRPLEPTLRAIDAQFGKKKPVIAQANTTALKAGYAYCEMTEVFQTSYEVPPAPSKPGTYRNLSGNQALAWGLAAAAQKSGTQVFYGSYPITPASDILHELSALKHFNICTFQAEDEIAACAAAVGAAFAGSIGITGTSGPGSALKMECVGLAVMTELPLVIVIVQRGGPSTGMPTKTEQADLLHAVLGRPGESPAIVIAPCTPGDCFEMAMQAVRLAVKYMSPVYLLSDGYLANGAEPWRIPELSELPEIKVTHRTDPEDFLPYLRDEWTLARPWAIPGTPKLEHRIGGLSKAEGTGNVSYDPKNHERMIRLRAEKVERAAREFPKTAVTGAKDAKLLVMGWGSTYGAITAAVERATAAGYPVAQTHLRYLNPLPNDLEEVLRRHPRILIPEMNSGNLKMLLRARYLIDIKGLNKIQGQPFTGVEIFRAIQKELTAMGVPGIRVDDDAQAAPKAKQESLDEGGG
jgi:2-oxoglutarate ferredoxin oxidoreductase subunit alpha